MMANYTCILARANFPDRRDMLGERLRSFWCNHRDLACTGTGRSGYSFIKNTRDPHRVTSTAFLSATLLRRLVTPILSPTSNTGLNRTRVTQTPPSMMCSHIRAVGYGLTGRRGIPSLAGSRELQEKQVMLSIVCALLDAKGTGGVTAQDRGGAVGGTGEVETPAAPQAIVSWHLQEHDRMI